jgi:hypothetical protein
VKAAYRMALALGVLALGGLAVVLRGSSGPPDPQFICHRLLDAALQEWKVQTTNEALFPNVGGSSSRSLALLVPYLGGGRDTNALRDYMYVPGLRSDDSANLILFYLRAPSRRTWHGDTVRLSGPRRWIVLNPRMHPPDDDSSRAGGELDEAISLAEFSGRLQATLDYLKRNARPGWQAVEQEHMRFLNSIKE